MEPKTRRSQHFVPVARVVMRQIEDHVCDHAGPASDAPVFTAARWSRRFPSGSPDGIRTRATALRG
ncbi:MAG TPA: hypothetical protein VFR88_03680, partial [Microlunatus sp.]|nr:hypothetical protein [Microlunatus sp.]